MLQAYLLGYINSKVKSIIQVLKQLMRMIWMTQHAILLKILWFLSFLANQVFGRLTFKLFCLTQWLCVNAVFSLWFHIDLWCNDWCNNKWSYRWFYWSERGKQMLIMVILLRSGSCIHNEILQNYSFPFCWILWWMFTMYQYIDCGIHAGIESVCCCLRCRMACYLLCWGSDISLFEVICAYNYKANPFYQKLDLIIFSTSWLTIGGFSFGHWKTGNRIWNGCLFLCGAYLFTFLKINTSYLI